MQYAIPAVEYNADQRAERARGAGLAFLIVSAAVIVVPVLVLVGIWLA